MIIFEVCSLWLILDGEVMVVVISVNFSGDFDTVVDVVDVTEYPSLWWCFLAWCWC